MLASLAQHPGWGLIASVLAELVNQQYRSLAQATDKDEMLRLQGDIRTYTKVLGLPADLGKKPMRV